MKIKKIFSLFFFLAVSKIYAQGKLDFEKLDDAVVVVETFDVNGNYYGHGSGFIIDAKGTVVTNYHNVITASSLKIMTDISGVKAEYDVDLILKGDREKDLALLSIKSNAKSFPYLNISKLFPKKGEECWAIGTPQDIKYMNTISKGLVSNIHEDGVNLDGKIHWKGDKIIQLNAAITHGSSGGALLNEKGEVIGVTCGGDDNDISDKNDLLDNLNKNRAQLNFAISIDEINKLPLINKKSVVNPDAIPCQLGFYTNNPYTSYVSLYIDRIYVGNFTKYFPNNSTPSCGQEGTITKYLYAGTHSYQVYYAETGDWFYGSINLNPGECQMFRVASQSTQDQITKDESTIKGNNSQNKKSQIQIAISKTDNERFEEAIADFNSLTSKEPNNGEYWFYFGETYFKRAALEDFTSSDVDSAMIMYKKGNEINSTNPLPYIGIAKVLLIQGNEKDANTNFYKASTFIDPKKPNPTHQLRLAEAYLAVPKFRNPDESLKYLESLMKSDGKNPEVHIVKGDALFYKNTGNAGEAVKSYDKAYELDKKSCRAILKKGRIYKMARNEKLGLQYYQEAIKVDSLFAPAYREMAELYHHFAYDAKALENYKKYVQFNNSDAARKRLVEFMFVMKMYKDVIPMIGDLQAKGLKSCYFWRYLGWSLYEAGEKFDKDAYKKSNEAMEKFFTCAGSDFKFTPQDYKYKGLSLSKAYRDSIPMLSKAVDELKKAIEVDKEANCDLYGDIGMLSMKMNKYTETIEAYNKKSSCVNGLKGQDYYFLGRAYYFGNDYKMADTTFALLIKAVPANPLGCFWRARASVMLDAKNEKWLGKPYYECYYNAVKPEERTAPGNKAFMSETLDYLINESINGSKNNEKAKEYLDILTKVDAKYAKIPGFKKLLGIK
ncbi:MAG: trypsin-like peptidase domain-containing protein [Bacteroidota bacterium]|jgi:tetratricopeptide (TPR) repeat protein